MPAAKFRPVLPSTTTRPPVMYSHPWSPTPSTTATAPELRTQNRSPTLPRRKISPPVVLRHHPVPGGTRLQPGHVEDRGEVQARGLPVLDRTPLVQQLGVPDRLGDRPETQSRQVLADLLRDELEEVHHVLGLAAEL